MAETKMLTVRLDADLYALAKSKSKAQLGIPLASLVKIFLKSFTTQKGVGFYIGNHDLAELFNRWMNKRKFERMRGSRVAVLNPRLKDLFELKDV